VRRRSVATRTLGIPLFSDWIKVRVAVSADLQDRFMVPRGAMA
jgi:hypothetical protein